MKIDLLGGSYQQKYKDFNSQRTINWTIVPAIQVEKDTSQAALFPTPGLTRFVSIPGRFSRGMFTVITHDVDRCFHVVDNGLYELLPNHSYLYWGIIPGLLQGGSSTVWMAANDNDEMFIGNEDTGCVFNLATNVLTQIPLSGPSSIYPTKCSSATSSDGYIFITSAGSVFFSQLNEALIWPGTNTYAPTWKSAKTVRILSLREQIYNFTKETIEIYLNDGVSPYSRLPRSTIYVGLKAKDSVAVWNDGFLFLGVDPEGQSAIYYFDGWYTCQAVSPFSVTWALNNNPQTLDDAHAFIQRTKDGHVLYHLTIPGLHTTFVYDMLTKEWTERQSKTPYNDSDGTNHYHEFRGRHFTNFKGMNLFADLYSGNVFIEDYANFTEDGNTIKRQRISQEFTQDDQNISVTRLGLDCNAGYGMTSGLEPHLMLDYSKDHGWNYFQPRLLGLAQVGDHIYRPKINKLGTSRQWTMRLTCTDPVDIMIMNAIGRGDIGTY